MGKSTPLRPPGFQLICCTWFVLHNLYYAICGPSSPLNEEVFGIHFMLLRDRVPEMRHLHCQQELLELLECNRHQLHVISRLLRRTPLSTPPNMLPPFSRYAPAQVANQHHHHTRTAIPLSTCINLNHGNFLSFTAPPTSPIHPRDRSGQGEGRTGCLEYEVCPPSHCLL